MTDECPFPTIHPMSTHLLETEMIVLRDFCSTLSLEDLETSSVTFDDSVAKSVWASPKSPLSVEFPPPCCPPSPLSLGFSHLAVPKTMPFISDNDNVFIKAMSNQDSTLTFVNHEPLRATNDGITSDTERERRRRRQRSYEKRYRARKRTSLKVQRQRWLRQEMELDAARKKHCKPVVLLGHRLGDTTLQTKLLLLLQEERALRQDHIAMQSLRSWEEVSRIREFSDKDVLGTTTEWQFSANKVIGHCAKLGPYAFNPYVPKAFEFSW